MAGHPSTHRRLTNGRSTTPQGLTPGAMIVLGTRGPNARVAKDGWRNGVLAGLAVGAITEVTAGADRGTHVTLTTFFLGEDVHGVQLNPHIMEALRVSANQQGRPVVPDEPWSCLGTIARLIEHYPAIPSSEEPAFTDLVRLISSRATALAERTAQ